MLKKHIHTKKPSMTRAAKHASLMVYNTSKESYNHYFHKYFYTYGGATDVKTLQEFIRNNLWDEARIFTNKKKMNKGLKAPNINGKIISEKIIDNDKLEIIRPN